jgi:hypothetical protein
MKDWGDLVAQGLSYPESQVFSTIIRDDLAFVATAEVSFCDAATITRDVIPTYSRKKQSRKSNFTENKILSLGTRLVRFLLDSGQPTANVIDRRYANTIPFG